MSIENKIANSVNFAQYTNLQESEPEKSYNRYHFNEVLVTILHVYNYDTKKYSFLQFINCVPQLS